MVNKKTTRNTRSETTIRETYNNIYDTKLVIVLALLVFIYPLGIIFMWLWMKTWPVWLKFLIMLPLFLGLLMAVLFIILISFINHEVKVERLQELQQIRREQLLQEQKTHQFNLTPQPSPSLPRARISGIY